MKSGILFLVLQFCWFLSLSSQAEELIQLNQEDVLRLDIVSNVVGSVDNSVGASFAAIVINSPLTISTVTIPFSGILQNWIVVPGQSLEAGDVLVEVVSTDLLDLQTNWRKAQIVLESQRSKLDKDNLLLEQGVISKQRAQQTYREYQQVTHHIEALVAKLALAGFSEAHLESLNGNEQDLGVYSVRSPVSGTVNHLMVNTGAHVKANVTVASIGNNDRWLSAKLPARIANHLSLGQELRIVGSDITLNLQQKDFSIDATNQTIEIFAAFNNQPKLMVGQIVGLIIPPTGSGVLIPNDAVVHSGDETTVYVQRGNSFEARVLNLMPAGEDYFVTDGIVAGEMVVVRGAAILKGIQFGLGGE